MHAFILIGSPEKQLAYLEKFQKDQEIPSYFVTRYDTFKIADARSLQKLISLKLHDRERRLLVISFPTPEAQQALLKTVEELSDQNFIFFLAKFREDILPTITSRCRSIVLEKEEIHLDQELEKKIKDALAQGDKKRITDLFGVSLELSEIEQVVLSIRSYILEYGKPTSKTASLLATLKTLHKNYIFAKTNNINKKMVLETALFSS